MASKSGTEHPLESFNAKHAKLDNNSAASSLFGLVDMGSNGIRFSISDLSPPRSRLLNCIYRERAGLSLYDALHDSTDESKPLEFSEATISKVSQTLARFRNICDQYGVPQNQITVIATEAMRTAQNQDDMLNAIKKESGLVVDVLPGNLEAMFGAVGARAGYNQVKGIFMDLGGGSVQMSYLNSKETGYENLVSQTAKSLPYGAAKLTKALGCKTAAQPVQDALQIRMQGIFGDLKSDFSDLSAQAANKDGITIYFCGGGFRGYGSMLMHTHDIQPYPIPVIGGFTVSGEKFVQWEAMLKANDQEGKILGMSKRRRQQFPAIVTVVQAVIKAVPHIKQVVFSSGGNREGILYMKLPANVQEEDPISLLPGGLDSASTESVDAVVDLIQTALPKELPQAITSQLLGYIVRNIWINMGNPDDANAAKALHNPISGLIAGFPGLTHEVRALLALTLCARWGSDLGPSDKDLYDRLRKLIGPNLSFWADYIGNVTLLLATIFPTLPTDINHLSSSISFKSSMSDKLGKSGKKPGIQLQARVSAKLCVGVDLDSLSDVFKYVGKGLDPEQRVEASFKLE